MLDVPDILWGQTEHSNKPHFICSLFEQTSHGRILKNSIFRTNIIEGNLTCIKDCYLQTIKVLRL